MKSIIVVDKISDWSFKGLDAEIISAEEYLKDSEYGKGQSIRVVNVCQSYTYQKLGYYVSLVASARGHKPQPNLTSIEDFKSPSMIHFISCKLEKLMQESLKHIEDSDLILHVYFGHTTLKCFDRLAGYLFTQFSTPFLQAHFRCVDKKWTLTDTAPLPITEIPKNDQQFAKEQIEEYLTGKSTFRVRKKSTRYDLAVLINPEEKTPPSDKKALRRFAKAAETCGLSLEFITKKDFGRLAEFDALFIRETTQVNHYTYQFARHAFANGLIAIDDPLSILRCCNKIFLYALLKKYKIPIPHSFVVNKKHLLSAADKIDYPVVIKQPDGSFSKGVAKAENSRSFIDKAEEFLQTSDLILVQEFLPSGFDWRIGVLDGRALYACKYYMVKDHWQIYKTDNGAVQCGEADTLPLEEVPKRVVQLAVKACNLIGRGLYGVDIKEVNGRVYIIEINDNPNIDAGIEDQFLGEKLYSEIMRSICSRIDKKKQNVGRLSYAAG